MKKIIIEHMNKTFFIEKTVDRHAYCECCKHVSRSVSGLVTNAEGAVAAYWVHWTPGHLHDVGANLDIAFGLWGDGTSPADRYAVAMIHREQADGSPGLMVIDAEGRPCANGLVASNPLRRDDVIGRPLAAELFALVDAIYEQDDRLFRPTASDTTANDESSRDGRMDDPSR